MGRGREGAARRRGRDVCWNHGISLSIHTELCCIADYPHTTSIDYSKTGDIGPIGNSFISGKRKEGGERQPGGGEN